MLLRAITCMAMQQIRRWRRACCCMRFCWVCSILLAGRLCVGNVLQTLDNSSCWFCCLGVACNGKGANAASSIHAPCKAFLVCRAHEYWLCLFTGCACFSLLCAAALGAGVCAACVQALRDGLALIAGKLCACSNSSSNSSSCFGWVFCYFL